MALELRVFTTKWFARFARKARIPDAALLEAVSRAERGQIDADLGGGVIKQRIARPGHGKSGGFRTILFFRGTDRAVFIYGFAKSERANIEANEERQFKNAAHHVLRLTEQQIADLLAQGEFVEVKRNDQEIQE